MFPISFVSFIDEAVRKYSGVMKNAPVLLLKNTMNLSSSRFLWSKQASSRIDVKRRAAISGPHISSNLCQDKFRRSTSGIKPVYNLAN